MAGGAGGDPNRQLGVLLRRWRSLRGRSQLDLALDAGISQRHLSFVETGRSVPGRQTLLALARALDIPFRDRNAIMLAAGYAPVYLDGGWDEPQMRGITGAVERMLRRHEPFPAVLMDRYWNVLATNEATPRFFGQFIDLGARKGPRNILHLMFDPAGMQPFIRDWERTAASLIDRVHREAPGRSVDDRTRELLDALANYRSVVDGGSAGSTELLPMIPLSFEKDGVALDYFSMVTTVGTPTTMSAQELRLETMFPVDEDTERRHLTMMDAATP